MVPLEVSRLITGEAPPGLHLLGPHSTGHFHLEDRTGGHRVWPPPNSWGCTTLHHLLDMTHCHRHPPLPGVKSQDGLGRRPQPQGWWQQKPWSYGITACSQRYGQRPLVDWWMNWHPCPQASYYRLHRFHIF